MTSYFPLQPTFFGLTTEYHENVYEQFFFLKYHGGWGLMEAYNLPIRLRQWFVERLLRQKNEEAEQIKAASRGKSSGGSPPTTLGPGNAPSEPVTG
tara:strand:- start:182 stop:469 length:288 start_codon:yes stop_codon:yes gene_type:complete